MNRVLDVLFFKNGLDPIDGSAEHMVNYAVSLQRYGHHVAVLIANPTARSNQYLLRLSEHRIDVRYVGRTGAVFRLRCQRALRKLTRPNSALGDLSSWSKLLEVGVTEILREARPDLVHVFVDPAAPLGLRAAIRVDLPTLCHELISPRPSPETVSYYDELAEILPNCAGVAAQSPRIAHECRERIPFHGRVAVIPNIVEDPGEPVSASVHRVGEEVVFGFASRFEPRKAPLILLTAFAEALRRESRLRLRMAGDGPQRPRVLEEAARLGILQRCDFPGTYNGSLERDAFFDGIHVLVQPSLAEGLPNTVIEGMARAKAIISTPVGGIADVLSDASGLLVPPGDVGALASALTLLAHDRDRRTNLGRAGRAVYLRTFSPEAVLPVLLTEYQRILAETSSRTAPRSSGGRLCQDRTTR